MRISEYYGQDRPVFSFEFFPPKTDEGASNLMRTAADLKDALEPDFISVTSGAGGSTRDRTLEVVTRVQAELGITTMAHQTCVASSRAQLEETIRDLHGQGIRNVLALRGDPPKGETEFVPPADGFAHATELIEFIRGTFDVDIGGACYPEKHLESPTPEEDLRWTRAKEDLGANFLITQLFFDNSFYWRFVERARAAGVRVPIVPGIMPITNVAQVERFTKLCGATIPEALRARLRPIQEDPALVMATGIEHAITQCRELVERGAPGIHFYTLNKSHATRSILSALRQTA